MQNKRKSNLVIQTEQDNKQKNKRKKHLETKSKQNKTKAKNQKLKWLTKIESILNQKTLELQGKWFSW